MIVDELRFKVAESLQERDDRLWRAWKNASLFQKEAATKALLDALSGVIGSAINVYRNASVPLQILEVEGRRMALEACGEYEKNRGMGLASYVGTNIRQKLYRYVNTYQHPARIPEASIALITPFRDAVAELNERFGREPTTAELADHMGVPLKHVARMRKSLRANFVDDSEGGGGSLDAFEHDVDFERAMLAYYSLTDVEKQVFDFSLGAHGQPRLKSGEIASRLKISAVRVSQLKKSVADKVKPYLIGS